MNRGKDTTGFHYGRASASCPLFICAFTFNLLCVMADELAAKVVRFRDGLLSDRKELNHISVFQIQKLLSDHEKLEEAAKLIGL